MEEHWSLILRDQDRYKKGSFEQGDFISVTFDAACDRLSSICEVQIPPEALNAFNELRRYRNRYVHFASKDERTAVIAVQIRAWHHMYRLLEEGFLRGVSIPKDGYATGRAHRLVDIRKKLMRSEDFIEQRYAAARDEIERRRAGGELVLMCATCERESLLVGDGYPFCPVCGTETYPTVAADDYARYNDPGWKHPKHGIDDEVLTCPECGEEAVVEIGEELEEVARQKVEEYPRDEPGLDWETIHVCLACGRILPDWAV